MVVGTKVLEPRLRCLSTKAGNHHADEQLPVSIKVHFVNKQLYIYFFFKSVNMLITLKNDVFSSHYNYTFCTVGGLLYIYCHLIR